MNPCFRVAALLVALAMAGVATLGVRAATDFASGRQVDAWLRHPVLGDPSFDAFERVEGNPVFRGAPPLEWPVNGFLFLDPPSGRRYLYVGEYAEGYMARPSRCRLLAASTAGPGWVDLGVVLQGDPAMFDHGGHTPDVSVVYADGRYHMVYDWGSRTSTPRVGWRTHGPIGRRDPGIGHRSPSRETRPCRSSWVGINGPTPPP